MTTTTTTTPPEASLPEADVVERTVALFAAAAHPARLTTLLALARLGPCTVGDLQRIVGLEQSAMSHQLRVLREARLIAADRDGRQRIYRIADGHVAHLLEDAVEHIACPHPGSS